MILVLHGTSSAGRTSLALRRRWDGLLLAVGIDTVVFALPAGG